MYQQTTVSKKILKSLFFLPIVFAIVFSSNAQTQANISVPVSTDSLRKANPNMYKPDKDSIYEVVDKMPQFRGGEKNLLKYLCRNLRYPKSAQKYGIQGNIII